jgi:hypothetical protein
MDITTKTMSVTSIIQDYGFITTEITPKLASTSKTLIGLIDRVRMLDNDLIRLQTKVKTAREKKK